MMNKLYQGCDKLVKKCGLIVTMTICKTSHFKDSHQITVTKTNNYFILKGKRGATDKR